MSTNNNNSNTSELVFQPTCFDDFVSKESILEGLRVESDLLWQHERARSYWIEHDAKPRCHLEFLAKSILALHRNNVEEHAEYQKTDDQENTSILGAEFWVQIRDPKENTKAGLELHFDKDEKALEEFGIFSHPSLATATYLNTSDHAAPLLVLSTISEEGLDDESEGEDASKEPEAIATENSDTMHENTHDKNVEVEYSWVCLPRAGRHCAFDGRCLHGIPSDLLEYKKKINKKIKIDTNINKKVLEQTKRVSVLVNLWVSHKPEGVHKLSLRATHIQPYKDSDKFYDDLMMNKCLTDMNEVRAPIKWLPFSSDNGTNSSYEKKSNNNVIEVYDSKKRKPIVTREKTEEKTDIIQLHEHHDGDTGLLPKKAIIALLNRNSDNSRFSDEDVEISNTGLLMVRYGVPSSSSDYQ